MAIGSKHLESLVGTEGGKYQAWNRGAFSFIWQSIKISGGFLKDFLENEKIFDEGAWDFLEWNVPRLKPQVLLKNWWRNFQYSNS